MNDARHSDISQSRRRFLLQRYYWFPSFALASAVLLLYLATRWPFQSPGADPAPDMPGGLARDEARELYLTPAGIYSDADIRANGRRSASEAFVNFRAEHDFSPQPGDRLCPITRTKSNPACRWVIGGQTYEFCCPPCIDEFVRLAREQPQAIADPDDYIR